MKNTTKFADPMLAFSDAVGALGALHTCGGAVDTRRGWHLLRRNAYCDRRLWLAHLLKRCPMTRPTLPPRSKRGQGVAEVRL